MNDEQMIELSLEQVTDYEFRVCFSDSAVPDFITDEASPLGYEAGPDPSRLLVAAVANCLTASLLFALRKFKNDAGWLSAHARAALARNERGRWRIKRIDVELGMAADAAALGHIERALGQFEDFCIVTESVRQGIPVEVVVRDGSGAQVHPAAA